ncbi:MAG: VWA domain-containing protein [Planctomycetes bacterium]|nr:VWA domain-containing protein [Planctomycetota bacterium]
MRILSIIAASLVGVGTAWAQVTPMPPPRPQLILPQQHHRPVWSPRGEAVVLSDVAARVEIVDQVATTELEMTIRNPSGRPQEAVLVFPVADGVAVRSLQYDGVGPEPTAQLLKREDARRIYDEIVRSTRDPALVEFIGMNLVQTSVFPIPAGGTQKLRLTMEQVLTSEDGRVDYVLLRSNSLAHASCNWSVSFDIRSNAPITTVYSPSHTLAVSLNTPNRALAKVQGPGASVGTLRLSYLVKAAGNDGPGFTVFTYPDSQLGPHGGGYFMMLGGVPTKPAGAVKQKREVVLVIDRSGSMRGEKIKQAQAAALSVVDGLDEGEMFNIFDYSDSVRSFEEKPVAKDAQTVKAAREYITAIVPQGGTNIHDALLEALRPKPTPGMLPLVLFLTDGLPTIGERNEARLREAVKTANAIGRRVFTFGVGLDVNTPLLNAISQQSRGMSTFVLPDEDVEIKVSRVFKGLAGPVMGVPRLAVVDGDGAVDTRAVREVQPGELPDFFEGDQVLILGQFIGDRPVTLKIAGEEGGEVRVKLDPGSATMRNDFVPRMWASRKIAALLDEVRQASAEGSVGVADARMKELVDEVIRLSTRYGILTEYTAFLAREGLDVSPAAMPALRAEAMDHLQQRMPARAGGGGVNQELNLKALASAGDAGQGKDASTKSNAAPGRVSYMDDKMRSVEVRGVLQVGNSTLYQRNNRWVDSQIMDQDDAKPDRTVEFGTEEYLRVVEQLQKENRVAMLAQGGEVLVQLGKERVLVKQP